MLRELKMAKR